MEVGNGENFGIYGVRMWQQASVLSDNLSGVDVMLFVEMELQDLSKFKSYYFAQLLFQIFHRIFKPYKFPHKIHMVPKPWFQKL